MSSCCLYFNQRNETIRATLHHLNNERADIAKPLETKWQRTSHQEAELFLRIENRQQELIQHLREFLKGYQLPENNAPSAGLDGVKPTEMPAVAWLGVG